MVRAPFVVATYRMLKEEKSYAETRDNMLSYLDDDAQRKAYFQWGSSFSTALLALVVADSNLRLSGIRASSSGVPSFWRRSRRSTTAPFATTTTSESSTRSTRSS